MDQKEILAIKQANPLSDIIGRDIKLIKNKREYIGCCPFHGEDTPSFTVSNDKDFYHCFGCGAHGDVFDYLIHSRGIDFKAAKETLIGLNDPGSFTYVRPTKKEIVDPYAGYVPIFPVPKNAKEIVPGEKSLILTPKDDKPVEKCWCPSLVHPYRDQMGQLLGYCIRIYIGKKKITPTIIWAKRPDGSEGWTNMSFPEPRPFYIVGKLDKPGQQIIISAEGEKSAEAIHTLTKKTAIAWPQGSNNVEAANWPLLKDYNILIWPDKDKAGLKSAGLAAEILTDLGCSNIKILIPPTEIIDGVDIYEEDWDAYDALHPKAHPTDPSRLAHEPWNYDKFLSWAKNSAIIYQKPVKIAVEAPVKPKEPEKKGKKEKKERKQQTLANLEEPFKILGFDGSNYYYIGIRGQKIIALTASAHTRNNLFKLASEDYWNAIFPGERGIKWDTAVSWLIDASERMGIFTPFSVRRGRGAWLDDGRKIFHLGDKVLLEGKQYKPFDIKSEFVYEAEKKIVLPNLEALDNDNAKKLIEICEGFNWENPLSGKLLAGWCVIAGICGMLEWRPHIWITGGSNTGKTTATKVVRSMLKPFSRSFGGGGTEPGIRRSIQKDAIPVIIDEAEGENKRQREKIKAVLFLARQASSGDIIAMAGKDGQVEEFIARSCFCFSSINPSMDSEPDQTRITQLTLVPDYSGSPQYIIEKYEKLKDITEATITPEFASGVLMRAFHNIENLLYNIKIFQKAGSAIFKRPRIGEQLSPLIAGAYMCHSTGRISYENAVKWMAGHNWENHLPEESSKDIWKLLRVILSYRFRFTDGNKTIEKTLGQMILAISTYHTSGDLYLEEIRQLGIDVIKNEDVFYIANASPALEKILNNTPWEKGWGKRLKELPGAKLTKDGPHYYCPALKERGTSIPLALIRKEVIPMPEIPAEELGEEVAF